MERTVGNGGGGAATGCYKCGRPGHWSRDCPSNPTVNNTSSVPNPNSYSDPKTSSHQARPPAAVAAGLKPKKVPVTRPKLTPTMLLSDAGIGHILRHFPRAIKYRGRGHEVSDLGHLLGLYAEWHSRLLPYYPFDQFIHKVEQVGATKRVKICLRDLRERVANGVDPTERHEATAAKDSNNNQAQDDLDMPNLFQENSVQNNDTYLFQDGNSRCTSENGTEEVPAHQFHAEDNDTNTRETKEAANQRLDSNAGNSNQNPVSEEQRARIEANKLKALKRAAARARPSRPA